MQKCAFFKVNRGHIDHIHQAKVYAKQNEQYPTNIVGATHDTKIQASAQSCDSGHLNWPTASYVTTRAPPSA